MVAGDGLAKIRERLTKELADYSDRIEREISTRRHQIKATELKLKSLAHAVAEGAKLETLQGTIVELEAHKAHQEAELDSFIIAVAASGHQGGRGTDGEPRPPPESNPDLGRATLS